MKLWFNFLFNPSFFWIAGCRKRTKRFVQKDGKRRWWIWHCCTKPSTWGKLSVEISWIGPGGDNLGEHWNVCHIQKDAFQLDYHTEPVIFPRLWLQWCKKSWILKISKFGSRLGRNWFEIGPIQSLQQELQVRFQNFYCGLWYFIYS